MERTSEMRFGAAPLWRTVFSKASPPPPLVLSVASPIREVAEDEVVVVVEEEAVGPARPID